MTWWEWIVIVGGVYLVIHAIGEAERHAAKAAASLAAIEEATAAMCQVLLRIEDEVDAIRRQVAPESKPWTEDDV